MQFSEFTYAVCLFDHVEQTDRSMHTVSLGRNAVVCARGMVMWFTSNGRSGASLARRSSSPTETCATGPAPPAPSRSGSGCSVRRRHGVQVTFECSDETKIQQISEPERCFYHVEMQTPAACSPS